MIHTEKTLTVGELYAALEARMPRELSCDWDHDGLSVCPDRNAPVTGVLISLDPTEDAITAAEEKGCNVILTHHPMLFHGVKAVNGFDGESRKVIRLIRAGISTMAFHTRLDAVEGGVNDVLAARLGLQNTSPFGDGVGRVGDLPEAVSSKDFVEAVKTALGVPAVFFADCGKSVRRVAVLGGGGGDFVGAAADTGADLYVTGDLGYHHLCDAPYGDISLIAAGHFYTEAPVLDRLADMVAAISPDVPVHLLNETRVEII